CKRRPAGELLIMRTTPMPRLLHALALSLLLGSPAAFAHTVWLEADPAVAGGYIVRFGGHAGVTEPYPPAKLQQVLAFDAHGKALPVTRDDSPADGVRLRPQGVAALMTLSFDNGYWSKLASGRSENRPMDQVPGAIDATHAVKYHKSILSWD